MPVLWYREKGSASPFTHNSSRNAEAMKRPLMMRILPERLRASAFSRIYRQASQSNNWSRLFVGAKLKYAPATLNLVQSDFMHAQIAFTGVYEAGLSRRFIALGRKGGTLVDVGANVGYFSFLWTGAHPNNNALALEASPHVFRILQSNIENNELGRRIEARKVAAGHSSGVLEFDLGPSGTTGWGGFATDHNANTISVPVVRLDDTIENSPVNLLKIDVEGADTWVLFGAERLLMNKLIKMIFYEQNKPRLRRLGIEEDEARLFLERMGYRARPISHETRNVVTWMAWPS
jgi:FkbM family methyltransferase